MCSRSKLLSSSFILLAFFFSKPMAAEPPVSVPEAYRGAYAELDRALDSFEQKIDRGWDHQRAATSFGAEMLTANGNRGLMLIDPKTQAGAKLELHRLQGLGLTAVTIAIPYPLLDQKFLDFNGHGADRQSLVDFYKRVADDIHRRGMKMIVESGPMFPGVYSAQSGLKVGEYYKTLSDRDYGFGRAAMIETIGREIHPDAIQVSAEPDTEATITGKAILKTHEAHIKLIVGMVKTLRAAGVTDVKIGAGVGVWLHGAEGYLQELLAAVPELDFVDLHVYPITGDYLDKLIALADIAISKGKDVAVLEAWETKLPQAELGKTDAASDPSVFARDSYSFWAPIDQKFIRCMVNFAHWKKLTVYSPFWSQYFFAYNDYEKVKSLSVNEIRSAAVQAAVKAIVSGTYSETGNAYRSYIAP